MHGPGAIHRRPRMAATQLHQPSTLACSPAVSWVVPKRSRSSRTSCTSATSGSWVKNRCTLRASLSPRKARFSPIRRSALRQQPLVIGPCNQGLPGKQSVQKQTSAVGGLAADEEDDREGRERTT